MSFYTIQNYTINQIKGKKKKERKRKKKIYFILYMYIKLLRKRGEGEEGRNGWEEEGEGRVAKEKTGWKMSVRVRNG